MVKFKVNQKIKIKVNNDIGFLRIRKILGVEDGETLYNAKIIPENIIEEYYDDTVIHRGLIRTLDFKASDITLLEEYESEV